ncbi:hypothetical protein [Burkholderia ubonensis]|uniref:hypothetical protein n=1 Tax=Burkholderia ubonensis TaxID=101571 RepID=UPI000B04CBE5|nr:hypothetical protein [Burkholderia ubonensis]
MGIPFVISKWHLCDFNENLVKNPRAATGGRVREKGFSRLIDIRHLKWIVGVNADGIFTYWQRITTEYWPGAATQPAHA